MAKYSLVGVDGNAYSIMGYTMTALKNEGLGQFVDDMVSEAKSGNYNNLICTCMNYITLANAKAVEMGYVEDDEDE